MLKLEITAGNGGPVESLPILNASAKIKPQLRKGLREAGALLNVQIRRHLTKYKRETPPGREFPAFQSGALFRSVYHKAYESDGMPAVEIGPNTAYAAIHEFGGMTGRNHSVRIPARPYVGPAWVARRDDVVDVIAARIREAL